MPFDVMPAADTIVQSDVLVTRRDDLVERGLDGVPLLVVEVFAPAAPFALRVSAAELVD